MTNYLSAYASIKSSYSLEKQLEPDFSFLQFSGRQLTVAPKPIEPKPDLQADFVIDISPETMRLSRLNINRLDQ